jgi:hypothetical protein
MMMIGRADSNGISKLIVVRRAEQYDDVFLNTWWICFREYVFVTFYQHSSMDCVKIYCALIKRMDSLIQMNLIRQATKLAIYTYHKVIVVIIMNSMVQIKIWVICNTFVMRCWDPWLSLAFGFQLPARYCWCAIVNIW